VSDIIIKSSRIVTPDGIIKGYLLIRDGKIHRIKEKLDGKYPAGELIDVADDLVIPGFIDLHIHGAGGYDIMDGTDKVHKLAEFLAKQGTTSFYATTDTTAKEKIIASIKGIVKAIETWENGAEILGIHLEGPFLNLKEKGAMPPEALLDSSIETMKEFEEACGGYLRRITVAPEIDGALEMIRYLKKKGYLIAGGHTAASYEETLRGISAGVSIANHMFNAMQGLHHRNPGAAGAYLTSNKVFCEVIGDLKHVHPAVFKLILKSKGLNKVYLISDAILAAGLEPGSYQFAGRSITVGEDRISRLPDGTIAGSTFLLKDGFKNLVEELNLSIEDAVELTAGIPARVAGTYERKGSLTEGKDADITVMDHKYQVRLCIVRGVIHRYF